MPKAPPTPKSLGYSFPAEWARHSGTWFSWPRPEGISFPGKYHTIPENLVRIFAAIAPREVVHINVPNENYERIVKEQLLAHKFPQPLMRARVKFHHIKTNECWCRDHGPAFLEKRGKADTRAAIVDWGFNAWGGKYPPWDEDDRVPTRIAEIVRGPGGSPVRLFHAPIVMEGGAIDVNGAGTLLTTTSCLLHKNRNPTLSKATIEWYLKEYYGQENVVWLGEGIEGDDTDGHVDDLARFVDERTIVVGVEEDPKDPNFKILNDCVLRLTKARDAHGNRFTIVPVPMPGRIEHDGQRLPATYMNFAFVNGALLLPTYGDRARDSLAQEIFSRVLPKHDIVPIDCRELIWGLGSIHCLSQQVPASARVVREYREPAP
jgi:agmatine deiminase